MKGKDLLNKMRDQEAFTDKVKQNADGSLVSEEEGTISLDELKDSKEHGQLQAFIAIGRLGHLIIQSVGYANGNLTNIQSSPRYTPPTHAELEKVRILLRRKDTHAIS